MLCISCFCSIFRQTSRFGTLHSRLKQCKHVLDFSWNSSWNLLEICSVKFVDTLKWLCFLSCVCFTVRAQNSACSAYLVWLMFEAVHDSEAIKLQFETDCKFFCMLWFWIKFLYFSLKYLTIPKFSSIKLTRILPFLPKISLTDIVWYR